MLTHTIVYPCTVVIVLLDAFFTYIAVIATPWSTSCALKTDLPGIQHEILDILLLFLGGWS